MLGLLIVCWAITGVFSLKSIENSCPNSTIAVVDLNQVEGIWYEYKHSSNIKSDVDRCFQALWGVDHEKKPTIVSKTKVKSSGLTLVLSTHYNITDGLVQFTQNVPILGEVIVKSSILEIDHKDYTIIWACQEHKPDAMFYVYTREPEPCECDIEDKIISAFEKHGYQVPNLVKSDNKNCCKDFQSYGFY